MTQSAVLYSLHKNCHHQIVLPKSHLPIEYPTPYKCLVWNYKPTNTLFILDAINEFTEKMHFLTVILMKKVEIFNEIILHIFSNYSPYENYNWQ